MLKGTRLIRMTEWKEERTTELEASTVEIASLHNSKNRLNQTKQTNFKRHRGPWKYHKEQIFLSSNSPTKKKKICQKRKNSKSK